MDRSQLPHRSVEHAQNRLHRNEVNDVRYRKFLSRLALPLLERLPAGLSGLDYGCGPGPALATMLIESGHRMAVYDPLYFNDPKLLDDQYDFITCTEVVEHFHRAFDEFAQFDRLLKHGGWLAVMTIFQTYDAAFAAGTTVGIPRMCCSIARRPFEPLPRATTGAVNSRAPAWR